MSDVRVMVYGLVLLVVGWYVLTHPGAARMPHYCTPEKIVEDNQPGQVCVTLYSPVCGRDGVTYGNVCGVCKNKDTLYYWVDGKC